MSDEAAARIASWVFLVGSVVLVPPAFRSNSELLIFVAGANVSMCLAAFIGMRKAPVSKARAK